ncbi:MAG: DEAD/DEAH box helicase [Mucilaginibacter sp.]
MAWSDKLKLNKQLVRSLNDAGYGQPTTLQAKALPRIIGGQDLIAVGHEGSGKTTAYIVAVLNRLKYNAEGVPLVLILVPDQESVLTVIKQFELLNRNDSLSIVGLYAAPGLDAQMNALADGADIVVATPDRARAIYLKLGLNLNKINLLIIDNAHQIVKQGLQLPVAELANSITKCQHLVFTEVLHDKLNKMIEPFMKLPALIEVDEIAQEPLKTYSQLLYNVPDFGTKLNLLNLFMQDDELFTKTVVFVNTRQTAEKIYKTLQNRLDTSGAIFKSWSVELKGIATLNDFKQCEIRTLIVVNDNSPIADLHPIPVIIHFELPDNKDMLVERIINHQTDGGDETMCITFATDLELAEVKRIEQIIGQKIPVAEVPDELIIQQEKKMAKLAKAPKPDEKVGGEAFHQKKAANSKTYNYGSGQKAKMNNKKKHS